MREIGVLEAKTNLSSLLDAVERGGEDIVITRHGKPVARLSAATAEAPRARKLSGAELVERLRLSRERIVEASPEIENVTWEELKQMAHE
jgi:prevent-host-death family protein